MHGASADADFARNLQDAAASLQMLPDALFQRFAYPRPTELRTGLYGPFQPGVYALTDHASLELSESARNLEHQTTGWRRGVECLLVKVQIDA